MSIAVFGDPSIDRVALAESWALNPTPADLDAMYRVEEVDGRLVVTGPCQGVLGARSQVYCPPNFLHRYGKELYSLSQMAENLNMGCRYIDVVMAHEATYHPDQITHDL
jgi:hypothetical protein